MSSARERLRGPSGELRGQQTAGRGIGRAWRRNATRRHAATLASGAFDAWPAQCPRPLSAPPTRSFTAPGSSATTC
eukprot:6402904-Pyramimonas_sp.AAC.1